MSNLVVTAALSEPNATGAGILFNPAAGSTLRLTGVNITNNATAGPISGDGAGLAIIGAQQVFYVDSTVSGNTTPSGTASKGAGIYNEGFLRLDGVTVSANIAGKTSVPMANPDGTGGGIYVANTGTLDLRNCTIAGNAAGIGGGLAASSGVTSGSSMRNCTITANTAFTAGSAGGIDLQGKQDTVFPGVNGNPFTSNIVANNLLNTTAKNCAGAFGYTDPDFAGYNLSDETSCSFDRPTDLTANPLLAASLADNGGPAMTYRILVGSPAIDAGNPVLSFAADARGAPMADGNEDGTVTRDIGAYEFGGFGVVEFTVDPFSVKENAGNAVVSVRRYGDTSLAMSASVATSAAANGGTPAATAGTDYTATTGNLSWAAAEGGTKSFNVPITDDNTVEGAENIKLTLTPGSAFTDFGVKAPTANLTLVDFEEGVIQFKNSAGTINPATNPTSVSYTRTEADAGQAITLERVSGKDGAVSVQFSTGTGTATANADYTPVSQTVSWADGDATDKTVIVPIVDDAIYEDPSPNATVSDPDNCDRDNETVPLTLSAPTGNARLPTASPGFKVATYSITDNDPALTGTFVLSASTYSVTEGANLPITVKRTGGSDCAVSVLVSTTDGTAVSSSGGDYTALTATTGLVTWAHGDAADKTLSVTIANDTTREADETFSLALGSALPDQTAINGKSPPATGTLAPAIGAPSSAIATIVSDEKLQFQFSAASYTANEGTNAAVVVQVVSGQTITAPVLVNLTTSDDTANSADYTTPNPNPQVLTFDASNSSRTVNIPITSDGALEFTEQFKVALSSPDGEATFTGTNPATVVIPGNQEVKFSASEYHSTNEGGTITFAVKRINGSTGTVSVQYTIAPGTATQGSDYTTVGGTSGTLTWAAGDVGDKFVDINVVGDRIVEQPDETILLTLSNATNALVSPSGGAATAFITDDDIDVVFGAAPSATEGSAIPVTVKRVGISTGAVSVNYATSNGTAIAGTDYTAASGTLNWASGDAADKTFGILTANNTRNNVNKTINLTLSNPSANADAGPPATTTATITDDDSVTVAFSAASQTVAESAGMVTVTAVRTGATDFDISIPFTVSGTANAADHAATDGVITIPANATSGSYTFMLTDDARDEPAETIVFTMGTPTGGSVSAVSPSTHTVTITDNDATTVAFSAAAQAVSEGVGAVTVTVTRTGATDFDIQVPFTVGGTAMAPADHNASASTLTIPATASSATYTFNVVQDTRDEPDETVTFTLGTPSGGDVTAAAPATHTVTITDDDAPPLVSISGGATRVVVEGSGGGTAAQTVTFVLSAVSGRDVTVPFTVGGTANSADHNAANGSVTIAAGQTSVNYNFTTQKDNVPEDDETITFTIGTPTNATVGTPGALTITLKDDDGVVLTAGENGPGVVVTPSGNVAAAGGGGSFSWSALLGLVGLGALRRRGPRRLARVLALLALVPGLAQAATPLAKPKAAPVPASAPAPKGAVSYSGIDARYVWVKVKDPSTSATGVALGYTHTVGNLIFMGVGYSSISTGDFTVQGRTGTSKTTSLSVTLGLHRPISSTLDSYGAVDYLSGEAKSGGNFIGETTRKGWGLEAGLRGRASPLLEWGAGLNYVSIFGSSDTSLTARGLYHFNNSPFGVAAGLGLGSHSTSFNLGLRYEL